MINNALYSFICQTLPGYKAEDFHHLCFDTTVNSIIDAIKTGKNISIGDPELIATDGEFIFNPKTNLVEWSSTESCPQEFPFETLCLWHTPVAVDMGGTIEPIRHQHLICVRRISPNIVFVNYALCQESPNIQRSIGEPDYSWEIIPYGCLYSFPFNPNKVTIPDIPACLADNFRLKLKIKDDLESSLNGLEFVCFYRDGENRKNLTHAMGYFTPGYTILMGFLEKMEKMVLKPKTDPKIEINNPRFPKELPEVNYLAQ